MNHIEKDFVITMTSQKLNYNNVKQVNLIIDSTIDESTRTLVMTNILDYEIETFIINEFIQSIRDTEVIRGWVSFDNDGWIERDEANGIEFWAYRICPKWEVK